LALLCLIADLSLHSQAKILSNLKAPTCRQVMVLTGLIAAFCKAVPLLRLRGRWLQMSLNSVYSSEADLQKTVILCPQAKRDLQWIISLSPHQCFAPLWCLSQEACDLEVKTDASNLGFGIWFQGFLHQGTWDSTTAHLHINVLETTALWNFFFFILPKSSKPCNLLWKIDNTTALTYVKKEGGTCCLLVLAEAEKVLVLAHQMSVRILTVYIPTEENILADAASRFQEIPGRRLHPFVFQAIAARWGLPVINLFASNASKQTTLLQLERLRQPRKSRHPVPEVGLPSRIRLPTNRSPQESGEEAGDVERHLQPGLSPLGSPDVASVASDVEGP
jgi:hypothetical protein